MIAQKGQVLKEMDELEEVLAMYKEAYPDNPVFSSKKKQQK